MPGRPASAAVVVVEGELVTGALVAALDTPGTPGVRRTRTPRPAAARPGRVTARGVTDPDLASDNQRVPLLARPMASYYLIASASALLAGLGLVMVLSASSVTSYATSGSSFSIFVK